MFLSFFFLFRSKTEVKKKKHPEINFLSNVIVTPCSRPPFYLIGSPSPLRALSGWGVSCVAQTFAPLLKEGGGKKSSIHNSGCWIKWLRLKYWCVRSIAVLLTLFCAPSLLLIAFTGSAKCFEPRPHPVHTHTRAAGQRVRRAAVSGWVCTLSQKQLKLPLLVVSDEK